MNLSEYIANMEATAEKVTGRAVTIRIKELFSAPINSTPSGVMEYKVYGMTRKDLNGRAVIDLDPEALKDIQKFAKVFCEELAHIVKHFQDIPRADVNDSFSKELQAYISRGLSPYAKPKVQRQENEADELAAQWMKVINCHYLNYEAGTHDPIMAVLQIMYHKIK